MEMPHRRPNQNVGERNSSKVHKVAELVNKTCVFMFNCVNTLQKTMNSNNVVNYIFPCRDINDE
jgi:hypothetical protein